MQTPRIVLLAPLLAAACLLSACAGPVPKQDPSEAWIGLRDDGQDVLLGERVDGKNTYDGRFFEVKPGGHDLQVMLYDERTNDNTETCQADIQYSGFKAGQRYRVVETNLGNALSATLQDVHGATLAHSGPMDCMPG